MKSRKPNPVVAAPAPARAFRSDKRTVRYAGHRWRLKSDRGNWLLIERGKFALYAQWVPAGACR